MDTKFTHKLGTLALGVALAAAAIPSAASAQEAPPQGPPPQGPAVQSGPQDRPSYASPGEDSVRGRIISFDGQYNLTVRDDNGYVDHVQLHQGTIINPTGLTLHPGMSVTILGVNQGSILAANEVDTPYNYGPRIAYGYPAYAYPPIAVGLGFHFR
jgi:hypothetical protein